MKHSRKHSVLALAALVLFFAAAGPAFAWYFFVASNGQRLQWVFGSSCNANARPIKVYFDSDTTATQKLLIDSIINDWNQPHGNPSMNLLFKQSGSTTITTAQAIAFLQSPLANQIWVVYDTDGSMLASLGVSSNAVLGIGLPLALNSARPQDICSGLIILNGRSGGAIANDGLGIEFKKTVLHELGHVLGFAHNIAGGNGSTIEMVKIENGTLSGSGANKLPIMYPFAITGTASTLHPDDHAGVYAVYGP